MAAFAASRSVDDEEDAFLLDDIATPRAPPTAFADMGAAPASLTPKQWLKQRAKDGGGGASASDFSSMLNSFAQRFNLALLRGDGSASDRLPSASSSQEASTASPSDAAAALASERQARKARREHVFACKEVAAQVVGTKEALDLQRLTCELCRRPCEDL